MNVRHTSRALHDVMTSWTTDGIEEIVRNAQKSFKVEGIEFPLPGTSWEPLEHLNRSMTPLNQDDMVTSWNVQGTNASRVRFAENYGMTLVIGFCAKNSEPRKGELQLHLQGVFESTLGLLSDTQHFGLIVIDPYSLVKLFKQIS